jgi:hypothetical protein
MSRKTKRNKPTNTTHDTKIIKPFQIDSIIGQVKAIQEKQNIQQQASKISADEHIAGVRKLFENVHLHLLMPCYGGMLYEATMSSIMRFMMLASQFGLTWSLDTMVNESLVQRARNNLIAKALYNKAATHIMFIDSDISFKPESIIGMLVASETFMDPATKKHSVDIVAGTYPKKTLPIAYNINFKKETLINGPLFSVDTAATGFLMFKRKVIEDLIKAHPETKYVDDVGLGKTYEPYMYALFDCWIDEKGHYLSEDWGWCRRVQALGYNIWIDGRVPLTHIGTYQFVGDLEKMPTFQSKPTANIA